MVHYAAQKLSAITMAINPTPKTQEVHCLLDDSVTKVVFTTVDLIDIVSTNCPALRLCVAVYGRESRCSDLPRSADGKILKRVLRDRTYNSSR
jgi:hypothetical protein